jgi:hypothetical protein
MKLIKQGKQFDLSSSMLVAVSQWYMNYELKRQKLYKSAKGTFFEVTEFTTTEDIRKAAPTIFFNLKPFWFDIKPNRVEISTILTEVKAMDMFDYISSGKPYATQYSNYYYELQVKYEDMFDITEG